MSVTWKLVGLVLILKLTYPGVGAGGKDTKVECKSKLHTFKTASMGVIGKVVDRGMFLLLGKVPFIGKTLEQLTTVTGEVPLVFRKCFELIAEKREEGVYRVPGSDKNIPKVLDFIATGKEDCDLTTRVPSKWSVHDVASAVKKVISSLIDRIINDEAFNKLSQFEEPLNLSLEQIVVVLKHAGSFTEEVKKLALPLHIMKTLLSKQTVVYRLKTTPLETEENDVIDNSLIEPNVGRMKNPVGLRKSKSCPLMGQNTPTSEKTAPETTDGRI